MARPAPTAPLLLLVTSLVLVACGGGGTGTTASDPGDGDGGGGTTEAPAASGAPAPTEAPAASEPSSGGGGGGGGAAGDACGLVTVAEMEGLFGVSGVTQELFPGPPDTCDYQLDSAPFVAVVLTPSAAGFVFDAMAADAASEMVGGIGDRALYNAQMLTFLVQKGDALLTIQVLDESRSEAERLELMKQIGAIAAGRM